MKYLVTGSAGFVGSSLTQSLLSDGHDVIGVDGHLGGLYGEAQKAERTDRILKTFPNFTFLQEDLRDFDYHKVLGDVQVVFNEAAMPGLGLSWTDFNLYNTCNVVVVNRLLEALRGFPNVHLVHASTSSVYGQFANGDESTPLKPYSPYGVTKLAAENLISAYRQNFGLSATVLRYFSIYGPNQRPDMAYSKFIQRLISGEDLDVYGDGLQIRSNTFIGDIVGATRMAAQPIHDGEVLNICGDQPISLLAAISELADELGAIPKINFLPKVDGDQADTSGINYRAKEILGWSPKTDIHLGLRLQAQAAVAGSSSS